MGECIFCKIVKGEIPCKKVYEDDQVLGFEDINPAAPVHVLVIPKKHIKSLNEVSMENANIMAHALSVIKDIAKKMNIYDSGYRVVMNCGKDGGQEVPHIHFHILGGKTLAWPPG
ncbi:histidine triad nucleotide-binding protein [Clostridium botulinum]|uniref:HIT family hydrolase n=1 Tax=Clostridium botulinum C/D str. DC5 TaxID=1443128 RepID=A0A0A0IFB5_CLOBO|nr:histidine triad nucleotide-binding protein [Clostridium botulinum]KEI00968.1 HIT family hydrolase [Clostridium botulinum C/D str. BKT75002]KEI11134.1 HIT family hydrolase [Clostridium botulinum C/D str. BKT2873]KGM94054.1 HIT family hydrolase [Clostridium botulinum D str. CCUG 7971]KGM98996.1 HIT family hydrolase [Clostridium botulinum C/D str. DC5]KOC55229.1 HIT family hydrolase [Clostridium botulinum]